MNPYIAEVRAIVEGELPFKGVENRFGGYDFAWPQGQGDGRTVRITPDDEATVEVYVFEGGTAMLLVSDARFTKIPANIIAHAVTDLL
jgi:hypothetical protein